MSSRVLKRNKKSAAGANRFGKEYFTKYDEEGKDTLKYLLRVVDKLPRKARVLDVGCGKATLLRAIHARRPDLELHGIDIGSVQVFMPKYVRFRKGSGEKLPYKPGTFVFVICQHVLEHVHNPDEFMREYARVLKKGGFAFIESPYYKIAYIPDGNMNFWSDPTHVRPFNREAIHRLFIHNGFRDAEVRVWRNWISILIGPWLLLKRLFGDRNAWSTFCAHWVGNAVSGLGKK